MEIVRPETRFMLVLDHKRHAESDSSGDVPLGQRETVLRASVAPPRRLQQRPVHSAKAMHGIYIQPVQTEIVGVEVIRFPRQLLVHHVLKQQSQAFGGGDSVPGGTGVLPGLLAAISQSECH